MKILCKTFTCLGIFLCSLAIHAQTKSLSNSSQTAAMKEYTLLFRYPNITYTPLQLENLKIEWSKTLSNWKSKGIYISNQVLEPKGTVVTSNGEVQENTFAEDNVFVGATVTLLAESKEQAITLAKETPVFTVGGTVEIREPRYINKSNRVIFIDTFIVPEKAREVFIKRMNMNRELIKSMPGFVKDHGYEKTSGDSKFNYITVAIWESEEAVANARKAVADQYEKEGFNLTEFRTQNGITMERAMYREIKP